MFVEKKCWTNSSTNGKKLQKWFSYYNIENENDLRGLPLSLPGLPPLMFIPWWSSRLSQLQHAAEQKNAEELPAGLQERRRPRLHHVPACHHELPGGKTARTLSQSNWAAPSPGSCAHLSDWHQVQSAAARDAWFLMCGEECTRVCSLQMTSLFVFLSMCPCSTASTWSCHTRTLSTKLH